MNQTLYEGSVHGKFPCNFCHTDVSGYPHGKVSAVKCSICHFTGVTGAPKIRDFGEGIHGKSLEAGNAAAPGCQTCHGSHDILPANDGRSRTSRQNIPDLCSQCHDKEFQEYRKSIHGSQFLGKKNLMAAVCIDCHMEHHLISAVSEASWELYLIRECGSCHAGQLSTYRKTLHGKITRLGYVTVAKCPDCHGSHKILPRSDMGSAISDINIVATCGKCHKGIGRSFTRFYAHPEETNRAKYPVLFAVYFFMTALLIAVFAFFFIHTVLWSYRALRERMKSSGKNE